MPPLIELLGRHEGKSCAILGNGPSLNESHVLDVYANDVVIGCNRAYQWGPLDYLLFGDRRIGEAVQAAVDKHDHIFDAKWVIEERWLGVPGREYPPAGQVYPWQKSRRSDMRAVVPGMETREWWNAPGRTLACWKTTVMPAFHLAVMMGCKRVELYGCEGAPGPKGERHFFETGSQAYDDGERRRERLSTIHAVIEKIYTAWAPTGLEMANRSPGYVGWWPTV